jgi:thiamine-phosphate pyrophosphorylase
MSLANAPRLIAITDLSVAPERELVRRLKRLAKLAEPGSVALLLRDHAASGFQRLRFGEALREGAWREQQQLWVADRLDLALLLGADVLHLGEGSVSARVARTMLGPANRIRISRAWHTPTLSNEQELECVDALLLSPLLAPRKGRLALGVGALGVLGEQLRARHTASPQVYALGGVTSDNAASCLAAGATGVAAIGAALAEDPVALLSALGILI